jgi:hypothetical protein
MKEKIGEGVVLIVELNDLTGDHSAETLSELLEEVEELVKRGYGFIAAYSLKGHTAIMYTRAVKEGGE